MIVSQENSQHLQQQEIYLAPGLEVKGKGFFGVRTDMLSGVSAKPNSLSILHNTCLGSYIAGCSGFYQNTSIGNYCCLADGVKICEAHAYERITSSLCTVETAKSLPIFARFKNKQKFIFSYHTIIGHDVWLGSNVQIKNGLIIGHGAVVGAGSVVTKHVPPYAVVGGSPAKIIRMRFSEQDVERLLKSAWYMYDWQDIEIDWGDMHRSLEQMEEHIAAQDVPLLGSGYAYAANTGQMQLTPALWTLERQFEVSYGNAELSKVLAMPEVQKNMLQI